MVSFPIVDIQYGEPELAPGRDAACSSHLVQFSSRLDEDGMICTHTEDTHNAVVQCSAEYRRVAFCMTFRILASNASVRNRCSHSPTAFLWVGCIHKVSDDFSPLLEFERHSTDIRANDKTGQQEHGSSVLARPVSIICLEMLVEFVTIARGIQWCFRWRQSGQPLYQHEQ